MKKIKYPFFLPKKKTREEKVQHRIDDVFLRMISDADFTFSELELVHICNGINEKLRLYLDETITDHKSESMNREQKANETIYAKSLLK
jgi:hypothetical protein